MDRQEYRCGVAVIKTTLEDVSENLPREIELFDRRRKACPGDVPGGLIYGKIGVFKRGGYHGKIWYTFCPEDNKSFFSDELTDIVSLLEDVNRKAFDRV